MVPSDPASSRSRWRSHARVALVAGLVVVAGVLVWQAAVFWSLTTHFGSGFDARRFDSMESDFARDPAAFSAAAARMEELVADHPAAERIG